MDARSLAQLHAAAMYRWGIVFTALVPAIGSIIWYGVIPVDDPTQGIRDKALWVFCINPVSMAFLSFLFLSLFFTALDEAKPYRPFFSYAHILAAVYGVQVCLSTSAPRTCDLRHCARSQAV